MAKHKQIRFPLSEKNLLHEWKKRVGIELWKFTSKHFPLKRKLTGKELWVDTETLVNAIILTGTVPNAAEIRGFSAPVNKRISATRRPVNVDGAWRMVDTKTKIGGLGIYERPTTYYGDKHIELGYYGIRDGKTTRAYGLTREGEALPAYSYDAVTWLAEDQQMEVKRILDSTFAEVYGAERNSA